MIIVLFFFIQILSSTSLQEGCAHYDTTDGTKCGYCKSGYGYDSTTHQCILCSPGYYSQGGRSVCNSCSTFGFCSDLPENERMEKCPYYSHSSGNDKCEKCPIGKQVNLDFTNCYFCAKHCMECLGGNAGGKCQRCEKGFGLIQNSARCEDCSAKGMFSDGTTKCLSEKDYQTFLYSKTDGYYKYVDTENGDGYD